MSTPSSTQAGSAQRSHPWVESMGGPLIVVPVSALARWGGCTETGMVISDADTPDDYDRACEVDGLAGVIAVGEDGARALILADEPASTCYLPRHHAFLRWLAADSEADLLAVAEAVLADPAVEWEECGTWETDGPAVLVDSVTAGTELNVEYPNGGGLPDQGPVPLPGGRWTVRAVHAEVDERTWVGLIQLLRADA
ncbi:immunity 21 family protein [Streptomyces sp. NBC_01267]|uniref:immunity 21 family protein n=1 Tax=Streptomyces sp. NBC_01267 TaxID=2903805 RepID=UPI002E2EBF3C|nr:immunity 21 family protein [Streptomyces sp. NBC_01267]